MLVTDHRGLFAWTQVTLLAALGVALALCTRSLRNASLDVQFLLIITLMTIGLLVTYAFFRVWDGQWSYSSRFLTSPLPFYALGIALFMKRIGSYRVALPVVAICTAWALYLGLAHAFGHVDQQESATSAAATYVGRPLHPKDFLDSLWSYSRVRHLLP
jgi:hypothetical protein